MKKSAKYYSTHPEAKAKKEAYNREYQKKPSAVKKRVESNAKRREAKAAGKNISGRDYDHRTNSFIPSSQNRGAREKSRLKGSKRS